MAITVAQAREICTKSELELVLKSTTRHIGSLEEKELRSAVRRARTLRDKWRDQANSQTRDTKVKAPNKLGEANARSADKAQLFSEALERLEKRLSKVAPEKSVGSIGTNRSTKPARAAAHRQTRAETREVLKEKKAMLNAEARPPKKAAAKKAAAKKVAKKA